MGLMGLFILLLIPLIQQQISLLIEELPKIYDWIQAQVLPMINDVVNIKTLTSSLSSNLPKAGAVVTAVLHSSAGMIDIVVSFVLTPVVMFYLLRDWDDILLRIKRLLPQSISRTVVTLAKQCDEVLGAFFRGQLLIMFALCLIYSIGLAIVGLHLGVILGVIGGVLSIVPYLGSIFVVVSASIASFVQYGTWESLVAVLVVYLIGQAVEGYVLTPYLIGGRIGLHPVAVIFAIMAGGTLFGFFGVLLALPVAAVIMVVFRHILSKYRAKAVAT
jgi:predicted PurR-regulated permease PerM